MTQFNDRPIPLIDPQLCDGCGLCVHACPTKALVLWDGKAAVSNPLACEYSGLCETVCPTQAITRPFEIVVAEEAGIAPVGQDDSARQVNLLDLHDPISRARRTRGNSTKVVEKDGLPVYNVDCTKEIKP